MIALLSVGLGALAYASAHAVAAVLLSRWERPRRRQGEEISGIRFRRGGGGS